MSLHNQNSYSTLDDILTALGDGRGVGDDMTWVAKNYSKGALIRDLMAVRDSKLDTPLLKSIAGEAESDGRSARISKS
jgi:hypothetical protein